VGALFGDKTSGGCIDYDVVVADAMLAGDGILDNSFSLPSSKVWDTFS
jgi:hypothetical protein